MRVLILGATGIIGQHLRASEPAGHEVFYQSRSPHPGYLPAALSDELDIDGLLAEVKPDAVINCAGESNVDVVERDPEAYYWCNVGMVRHLAHRCGQIGARLIHLSSNAVFGGDNVAPYGVNATRLPVNAYGWQKAQAECAVCPGGNWGASFHRVVRATFVLGVRPDPTLGRENPVEAMLAGKQPKQVADRWFSVAFAWDVAAHAWNVVERPKEYDLVTQVGAWGMSRAKVAHYLGVACKTVNHEDFSGLAPRALSTEFSSPHADFGDFLDGVVRLNHEWTERQRMIQLQPEPACS